MKKQLATPLMLAALISAPSRSQSAGEGEKGKFTVTPAFVSDYYWRGQKQGGPSFQPSIGYEKGPWSFGLTLAVPMDTKKEKMSETVYPEIDLSASYEFSFANDHFKILPGILAYTYLTADDSNSTPAPGDDFHKAVIEPTVSFAFSAKDFNLSLNLYYDVIQKGPSYEVAAGYSISIAERFGVELAALAGKYDQTDVDTIKTDPKLTSTGNYWQAGVSVPIELTKTMTVTPGWLYSKGYDHIAQRKNEPKMQLPDEGRGVFSLSFSYTF